MEAEFRRLRAQRKAADPHREPQGAPYRAHSLLRAGLRMGTFPPGGRFVEQDLVDGLGLSRSAVREALQMLATAGLVTRSTKSGTVASNPITHVRIGDQVPDAHSVEPGRIVLTDTMVMDTNVILRQRFPNAPDGFRCSRYVLTVGPLAIAEVVEYRPDADVGAPVGDPLDAVPLRTVLERFHGVAPGHVETTVEAVRSDRSTARLLGIDPGAPVAVCETLTCDTDGEPRILQFWRYRADCVSFGTAGADLRTADTAPDLPPAGERPWDPTPEDAGGHSPGGSLVNSPGRAHALMRSALRTVLTTGYLVTEERLAADFGTGRNTARAAMAMLVEEGLIDRKKRAGTRVVRPVLELSMTGSTLPATLVLRTLEAREVPTNVVVRSMIPSAGEQVHLLEQMIMQDAEPIGIRYEYYRSGAHVIDQETAGSDRRDVLSVDVVGCDSSSATMLGVAAGAPMLLQEYLLRDNGGDVSGWGFTQYRGDRVALSADVGLSA
jgi:GntR family transcriptional regulator